MALIDRLRGACSADAGFMAEVKVVMEGNVCCFCTGGVRVFAFLASHGRWLVELFMAIKIIFCALIAQAGANSDFTADIKLLRRIDLQSDCEVKWWNLQSFIFRRKVDVRYQK